MENTELDRFFIEDNKIRIYKYKCTYTQQVWDYSNLEKSNTGNEEKTIDNEFKFSTRTLVPITHTIFLADSSNIPNNTPESFKRDYIDKHSKLDIVSIEPLDVSDIDWMDGIPVDKSYQMNSDYIEYLLNIGKESYNKLLTSTVEDYMTDLDYRLSLIEMGLN